MRSLKNKTLALVLASVVTVVGAFGSENYKNSLMGLVFESSLDNSVKMVLETKTPYNGNIVPIKRDANTYILMLPEIDSKIDTTSLDKVSSNITSVNIRTMPYSNNANGYTKITIKTQNPLLKIASENQVFMPKPKTPEAKEISSNEPIIVNENPREKQEVKRAKAVENFEEKHIPRENSSLPNKNISEEESISHVEEEDILVQEEQVAEKNYHNVYLFLYALLIVCACIFFYKRAKNNLQGILGENVQINVDEDASEVQNPNWDNIKKTIKTIDNKYSQKTAHINRIASKSLTSNIPKQVIKKAEAVDLDEIFKNQKSIIEIEEENKALEEFLAGFSFDEVYNQDLPEESSVGYDIEFYEKVLASKNLKFTSKEVSKMFDLINSEVKENLIKDAKKQKVSSPIEKKERNNKILEDLILTYSISQDISFKDSDVKTLKQLVNIELDSDFVTDLRVNHQKTQEMQDRMIYQGERPKKPSEIVYLKINEELPNLTEALQKLGNKKIESNYRADAVYFSEGYDVKILSVSADIKKMMENEEKKMKQVSIAPEKIKRKNAILPKKIVQKDTVKELIEKKEPQLIKDVDKNIEEPVLEIIYEGKNYKIVSTIKFDENKSCLLIKESDNYILLGQINENIIKLNEFKNLKSEKMQARINEKLQNKSRYIIRIDTKKLIIDVENDSIKYVMDLC